MLDGISFASSIQRRTAVARKNYVENLLFQFDTPDAANHFWRWLCESGEQSYWEWMKVREEDEDGDITGLEFDYDKADHGLIKVKCGRFTGGSEDV